MWDARLHRLAAQLAGNRERQPQLRPRRAGSKRAIATHQQGSTAPTANQLAELVSFEQELFSAEATDIQQAGPLTSNGATGGAAALAAQNYYPGINDAFGQDPKGAPFNKVVFTLFQAWEGSTNPAQASIARGEDLFNNAPMQLTDVPGLNDNPALGSPTLVVGTCGTCHDAPNIGTHSLPLAFDIGTSHLIASETDTNVIGGLPSLVAAVLAHFSKSRVAPAQAAIRWFT